LKIAGYLKMLSQLQSRKMRLVGHVARMGEMRVHEIFWSKKVNGSDNSEDLGVDGKIILAWILGK
jgi:hypothetical protein